MEELNELRKVAEQATPGPWTVMDVNDPGEGVNFIDVHQDGKSWEVVSRRLPDRHDDRDQMSADATHIATFDPPTVLALLSCLEQAEAQIARVREVIHEYDPDCLTCMCNSDGDCVKCTVADFQEALDGDQA